MARSSCALAPRIDAPRLFLRSQNRAPLQVLDEARDSITSVLIRDHLVITGCVDGYARTYDLRMGQLQADFFDRASLLFSLFLRIKASLSVLPSAT